MDVDSHWHHSGQSNKISPLALGVDLSRFHQHNITYSLPKGDDEQLLMLTQNSDIQHSSFSYASYSSVTGGAGQVSQSPAHVHNASAMSALSQVKPGEVIYPYPVYHLLYRLLDPDPESRITAAEALEHPFFKLSPL